MRRSFRAESGGGNPLPRVAPWAHMSHCVAVKRIRKNLCPRIVGRNFNFGVQSLLVLSKSVVHIGLKYGKI